MANTPLKQIFERFWLHTVNKITEAKTEINNKLDNKAPAIHTHDEYLKTIPSEYITETELNAKGYLTSTPTEVAIQNNQPSEGLIWIDTDSADEINLAEIDDNTVSTEKTWSSAKIKTLAEDIDDLKNKEVDLTEYATETYIKNYAQPKGNYVKSVNGSTPNENGDVTVITQVEAPKIVESVEEMVDTTKSYINAQTGTVWVYKSATYEKEVTTTDNIDGTTDNPYYENKRLPSSGTAITNGADGYVCTPLVDFTKSVYQGKTIQLHLEGLRYASETYETYVQNQLLGTDKTTIIAQRTYTSLDSNGNLYKICDSYEFINEKNVVLTITVPKSYNGGANIGYIRFCGKGALADSKIYITYKTIQTVTEEAWFDTGVSYGASIDAETLDKIASLNNEGVNQSTIKLLAKPVLDFYNTSAYPSDDYTTSHLQKISYPCRADIPVPYTVKWRHNQDAMRTTLVVDTQPIGTANKYRMRIYEVTGFDNYPIYNLLPNTTYFYKVTHVLADGSLLEATSGSFTTSNETIRLLYIDGTQNVRDLGGWTGLNNKKVKYGKLIRGASLSDSTFNNLMLTGKGRISFGELKVQSELNLGAVDTKSEIAQTVDYKKIGYNSYATAITNSAYRTMFKEALEWIVTQLTANKPIYFHCQGGCDRTGTFSFQLLGLLGLSESDIAKEYELSSFSDVGFGRLRTNNDTSSYDYVGMVEAIKSYSGSTLADKFYNFAIDCGLSADTITSFRNLMLG